MKKGQLLAQSNKTVKNVIIVAFSNIIKLISGVLVGFLIPKIMGDINYGYYKTYVLYLGYVGIFHFGFCDGIYLLYAGKKYEQLDKEKFRTYTKFIFIIEALVTSVICVIALLNINSDFGFIFLFVGISLFASNITSYYQFISQITGRFKELAMRNLYLAIFQAISVIIFTLLWYFKVINELQYKYYITTWSSILLILTLWYSYTYRDITFGKGSSILSEKNNLIKFFKIGFPLMIANLIASLILTIDKQFANILVIMNKISISEFGIYSFAYTMLSLITTVIAAISTVLYPTIKTYSKERLEKDYDKLISIIMIITSACLLAYQPLVLILETFLHKYMASLDIFRVILPGVIISSCVTMIMFNYYKTIEKHNKFFIISIVILIVSIILNALAYFMTSSLISISISSVITLIIWFVVSEIVLKKNLNIKTRKNILYLIAIITSYYIIVYLVSNIYISFACYFIVYILITYIFNKRLIKNKFR